MSDDDTLEFWDPTNFPWQVGEGSIAAEHAFSDGYDEQYGLIAMHVETGGTADTAPYPSLRKFPSPFHRPVVEGIRKARTEATKLIAANAFDSTSIAADVINRTRKEEAHLASDAGGFERPADWETARIHTTVTRVFTEDVVYTVDGQPISAREVASTIEPFHGRLHILGRQDVDTGVDLDGEYKVDLINSDINGPRGVAGILRLTWGSEASIVGAIACGTVQSLSSCAGFGPRGASLEVQEIFGELAFDGSLGRMTTKSGRSVWSPGSDRESEFDVFLTVDSTRSPIGIILDSTHMTDFT